MNTVHWTAATRALTLACLTIALALGAGAGLRDDGSAWARGIEKLPQSDPAALDEVWTDDHWVGFLLSGVSSCPTPDGAVGGIWEVTRLFEQSLETGELDAPRPALAGTLARYCAYQWKTNSGAAPDIQVLQVLEGVELARDRHAVVPVAPAAESGTEIALGLVWEQLREAVYRHLDQAVLEPGQDSDPVDIRVAVIDSSPNGEGAVRGDGVPNDGVLGHGLAVGMIIRELGCPEPFNASVPCVSQVANYLGLPLRDGQLDLKNGGVSGRISHLAIAINNAVSDWLVHIDNASEETAQARLVLNLSLGWDPTFGGEFSGSPTELSPATRAVFHAIRQATCYGALVVVAAGNAPGGPNPSAGPMYPAGWESKTAPTRPVCEQIVAGANPQAAQAYASWLARFDQRGHAVFAPTGVYRPLVHAVGGVRADDQPIALTRAGSRARLTATGAHVVSAQPPDAAGSPSEPPAPTEVLTGTSMAAAGVSGVAATVWAYRPELSAAEVIDLVYDSGVSLSVDAEVYWDGASAAPTIHRVSQCQALATACASGGGRCPATPVVSAAAPGGSGCSTVVAYMGALPELGMRDLLPKEVAVTERSASRLVYHLDPMVLCRHSEFVSDVSKYPQTVCPYRQYYSRSMRPGSGPQPYENACPACELEVSSAALMAAQSPGSRASQGTLLLAVSADLPPEATLVNPTLIVDGVEYNLSNVVQSSGGVPGRVDAGQVLEITDIPLTDIPEQATLSVEILYKGDSYSDLSELIITQR
ncbi:MAG: hypothetical protein Tsb0020_42980 [Haliangiales bacterium]